jgi:hypothetical protein
MPRALAMVVVLVAVAGVPLPAASTVEALLVPGREGHEPHLDVDGQGHPTLVWLGSACEAPPAPFDGIWVANRTDGHWSSLQEVVTGPQLYGPRLAHTTSGERWLAWTLHDGTDSSIHLKRLQGGPPRQFSFGSPFEPDLEVDVAPFGTDSLVVVWQGWRTDNYEIFLAVGDASGFSSPMRISTCSGNDREPRVVVGNGKAWIVWSAFGGEPYNLHHRTWSPDEGLSPTVKLTSSTRARNLHPELSWDDAGQRLWVTHVFVDEGWPGFNSDEPGPVDRGSPRVFAYDGTNLLRPLGLDPIGRPPLPVMEDLGYVRFDYSGVPMLDRFGTGVSVAVDPEGRLHTFHKQIGTLTEGSAKNRYWGVVGLTYDGLGWPAAPDFFQPRSSLGWEAPQVVCTADSIFVTWSGDSRTPAIYPTLNVFGIGSRIFTDSRPLSPAAPMTLETVGPPAPVGPCVPVPRPGYFVQTDDGPLEFLWGDMHRHSVDLSWDASSDPPIKEAYMYSQDWLGHDWMATTDHAERFSALAFHCVRRFAHLYDIPGVYRTFAGSERTMRGGAGGDQNLVFRDPSDYTKARHALPGIASWHDLYAALAEVDVLCIPHTTAQCGAVMDWEHLAQGDPSSLPPGLRLVEVYQSARQSFEYPGCPHQSPGCTSASDEGWVGVALAMGLRLGLSSSSDHTIRAAFTGVLAADRSRESIWNALHDRRAIGSSRTIQAAVDFRVNGKLMGSEMTTPLPPTITVSVQSPVPLSEIRIHRNGDPDWRVLPVSGTEAEVMVVDDDPVIPGTSSYYYARVADADSSYHYTSPVWVDFIGFGVDAPETGPAPRLGIDAYPNPSADAIRFSIPWIPDAGAVLRIHDVRGRLVREMRLSSGEPAWDGRDRDGRRAAAGRYFAVLQGAGSTAHTSFVLLR